MIKNIIYKHYDDISKLYYLRIDGGTGHGKDHLGGKYMFVAGYFSPQDLDGIGNISLDIWCDNNNLKYVTGNNIEEIITQLKKFEP